MTWPTTAIPCPVNLARIPQGPRAVIDGEVVYAEGEATGFDNGYDEGYAEAASQAPTGGARFLTT